MKNNILSGCLFAATLLLSTSCSDFLTETPKGKLTPEGFFSNQSELDMGVNALYAKVQAYQCNSNPMILECAGDDVTSTTGSNKAAYLSNDAFETPTDTKGLNDNWGRLYTIVKAANSIIDNAGSAATSQEEINIAMGQAHFWRAYAYFKLVRKFGPLPLILHNIPDDNKTELTNVEGIYTQIVEDLTKAESMNLPAKYTGTNRVFDGSNVYVSAQAVKSTLAAVYMSMAGYPLNKTEYYAKAADKAKEVIDGVESGKYEQGLLADWNQVYSYGNNHHNETILGIEYRHVNGGWSDGDSQFSSCHQLGSLSGWGDFLAERRYWANYPDGPRKDAVYAKTEHTAAGNDVDWWATKDGKAYDGTNAVVSDYRPMFVAFTVNKNNDGSPSTEAYDCTKPFWGGMCIDKRHQLIRYSEVLCWYAEAAARAGQDLAGAKKALKQVRQRAYTDQTKVSAVDGMGANELAEAAFEEHGYEVAGYVLAMVTRTDDQFRANKLKEAYAYRTGAQNQVLVPKGTLTLSEDANGKPFTYTLPADVVVKENMEVTAAWTDNSMYNPYPPTEVEKNPNLKR